METDNNNNMQTKNFGSWIWTIVLIAMIIAVLCFSCMPKNTGTKITEDDFYGSINNGEVAGVCFYGNMIIGVYNDNVSDDKHKVSLEDFQKGVSKYDFYFYISVDDDVTTAKEAIKTYNETAATKIEMRTEPKSASFLSTYGPVLLSGLMMVAVCIFLFYSLRKVSDKNMDFGRNRAKAETNIKVRFKDVAGCEEEKAEMAEIVEFLKNPKKFTDLGARIPKGVLMVGPPGTGKTLLGKAIAGEAGVPFFSITGSDFVEMFVGVGAARVRDLFENAKRHSPCLIFIDEIDAVGRQRGTGLGNTNDEREQTLNQLLVQMDGFESSEGIIVIAATNRPDVLDPALLRAGRFDRRITVGYPDVKAREMILRLYTKDKPMAENINYEGIARHLGLGITGADIENIVNEAAILAARDERAIITEADIMEGIIKVELGPQKKSKVMQEDDKKRTAYHESGHAIIGKLSKNIKQKVHEVSIIPRGMAGGFTSTVPEMDMAFYSKEQLLDEIVGLMGGRAAEYVIYKQYTTGASNDIQRATEMARRMITEYGMSDKLGSVCYGGEGEVFLGRDFQTHSNISDKTAEMIDGEVKLLVDTALKEAIDIITKNKDKLEIMMQVLCEKETIYSEEVDMIIDGKTAEEVIEFINQREQKKAKEDEKARKLRQQKEEQEKKEEEEKIRLLRERAMKAFGGEEVKFEEPEGNKASEKVEESEENKESIDGKTEEKTILTGEPVKVQKKKTNSSNKKSGSKEQNKQDE